MSRLKEEDLADFICFDLGWEGELENAYCLLFIVFDSGRLFIYFVMN